MKHVRWVALAAGLVISLLVEEAQSQTNVTGYISGIVSTGESGVVPGAKVVLTRIRTDTRRVLKTLDDGSFRLAALPVGQYHLLVEAEGFQPDEQGPINVNIGSATRLEISLVRADEVLELKPLEVVGSGISAIDVESVESSLILSDEAIKRLPVGRNLQDVALLAPGTTRSPVFGLVGFGGASVAENGYFLNGMDLTNFRDGMGSSRVPFEFYSEFQVKTGGYGAEFGRSTGGVVNSVSKRGGNKFEFGVGGYWEPDGLRESSPDLLDRNPDPDFDYLHHNSPNTSDALSAHVYGSGPLIKDHLFFYAMVEYSDYEEVVKMGPSTYWDVELWSVERSFAEDYFWGLKLDWQINSRHLVELTAFSDSSTGTTHRDEYNFYTEEVEFLGNKYHDGGGDNYILRYTGYFGQRLTLSAMAGQTEYDRTERSDADDIPVTFDWRDGYPPFPTPWINFRINNSDDRKRVVRFDGELDAGDHLLRFGLDYEENRTFDIQEYSGEVYWQYYDAVPGENFFLGGFLVPEGVTQVVQERINVQGGNFEAINTALYLEDHWNLGDNWTLYLGIRNETFDNRNAEGETFVEMKRQWAPRLGFAWDVKGDMRSKLYASAGRYFLPMPTNVNINMSGGFLLTQEFYVLQNLNPDGTPIKGELLADYVVFDGSVPDITELLDTDLDPMYQDEFILGYAWEPAPGLSVGIRGIYRDLRNAIEDVNFGALINEYAWANGYDDFYTWPDGTFVLTNPGTDADLRFDLDYDGVYERVYLTAAEIGMPTVRRTYKALELYFSREWRDDWALQGSYTWSRTKGNYEGWTDSFEILSPGPISRNFDFPEFLEGAYGRLPSDRTHTFKLFGTWNFADRWQLSGNFLFHTGAPYGARGCNPDPVKNRYGCNHFYDFEGNLVPRGSLGDSDNVYELSLGLQYTLPLRYRNGRIRFRVDVFNVFNFDTETERIEEVSLGDNEPNLNYLLPRGYQQPRYVRLAMRLDF